MYTLLQHVTESNVWEQTKADAEIIFKFRLESKTLTFKSGRMRDCSFSPPSQGRKVRIGEQVFLCSVDKFSEGFFLSLCFLL